ncbi:hypothetical protein BY996DRAFT_6410868 [Phakopsora pachyrhizi]|nr:hypothetical protein BY996DRAFT_6410868 [Phakopsora pachyrhizi]
MFISPLILAFTYIIASIVCLVPNARKGCKIWNIDACCQSCCSQKYATRRWLEDCHCVNQGSSVVYQAPGTVSYVPVQQPPTTYVVSSPPPPPPPTVVTVYHG